MTTPLIRKLYLKDLSTNETKIVEIPENVIKIEHTYNPDEYKSDEIKPTLSVR
jgi:hypothetical protein